MARGVAYLVCEYALLRDDEALSAEQQLRVLRGIRGMAVPHRKSDPQPDDFDTFAMRVHEFHLYDRQVITWAVGHDIKVRHRASYDIDSDDIAYGFVPSDGIRFESFIAIPSLGHVAVSDRTGDIHIGAKAAISRFETVFRKTVREGEAAIKLTASNADLNNALTRFDLDEFSFRVRQSNPHVGRVAKLLDDQFKTDGIGTMRGVARPLPGGTMHMQQDGYIERVVGLADAGYGQVGLRATTPEGRVVQYREPKFHLERQRNEEAQREARSLRIFVERMETEKAQNKEAAAALFELYG